MGNDAEHRGIIQKCNIEQLSRTALEFSSFRIPRNMLGSTLNKFTRKVNKNWPINQLN